MQEAGHSCVYAFTLFCQGALSLTGLPLLTGLCLRLAAPRRPQVAANTSRRTAVVSCMTGLFMLDFASEAQPGGSGVGASAYFVPAFGPCNHWPLLGLASS